MLQRKFSTLVLFSSLITLVSGCSTQYRKRDDEATGKVKSAAIIAFIDKQPASAVLSLNLNSGTKSKEMGGSSFYQNSEVADALYSDLAAAIKKTTGWTVLTHTEVASNTLYKDMTPKMMAPIKVMMLPKAGENWFMAKDIMVPLAGENLGREGRTKILNALSVDAVVIAEINTEVTGGLSINGIGPRRPRSRFDMKVYRRDSKEPIWIEGVTGPKSEESLGWFGFMDEKRLAKLTHESAKAAFDRLGAEIK